jgi:hypothetical protein
MSAVLKPRALARGVGSFNGILDRGCYRGDQMKQTDFRASIVILVSLFLFLLGCAAPVRTIVEPPPFPEGFLSARWGTSVDDVKKAIAKDGNEWYQDQLENPPFASYASGRYLDTPALFSYFFSPK